MSMPVEAAEFRRILGHWTTGVAVVTTMTADGEPRGLTANAVASVSLEPPLVLACVHNDAPLASVLEEGVRCAVSILSEGQKRAATSFADRYAVAGDLLTGDNVPSVADAGATLVGAVERVDDGGDHRIVLIAVETAHVDAGDLPPLVYWARGYRRLEEGS